MPPRCVETLLRVAVLVSSLVLVIHGLQPVNVCEVLQCPTYDLKATTMVYDKRLYHKQTWLATDGDPRNIEKSRMEMFRKLVHYTNGANDQNRAMNISLPFLTKVVRPLGADVISNVTMFFFLPRDVQNAAPAPRDPSVRLVTTPVSEVYVRGFGGWTTRDGIKRVRYDVMRAVGDARLYHDTHFYLATYNVPFQVGRRYNEMWVAHRDPPTV